MERSSLSLQGQLILRGPHATPEAQPLVSIIMNCYNGAKYLRDAIESVLAQEYQNWEVVFWDNQSVDGSASILQSYQDARIRYFYAPMHTVLYSAREQALAQCRGGLIAFLDVDDWWVPEKLRIQVPLFNDPTVGMSCGNYFLINERRKGAPTSRVAHGTLPSGSVMDALFANYFVHFSTLVVRKTALDSLTYIFDPRFSIIGDFDLVVRLSAAWQIQSVQRPIAAYRWHRRNTGYISGFAHCDDFEIWYDESRENPLYNSNPAFSRLAANVRFGGVVKLLHSGRRLEAFRRIRDVPLSKLLNVLVALLLPTALVRRRLGR